MNSTIATTGGNELPVVVREKIEIDGKSVVAKVYKTDRLLTKDLREQADELDQLLGRKMRDIERDIAAKQLLSLKGKSGVVRLWHEVGNHLSFVMDPVVVAQEDRKYVWRALYDHADKLSPGPPNVRANERPMNNHFYYCYLLAQFDLDFVLSAGHWTAWVEFFDSIAIKNDERIIKWFAKKQKEANQRGQDWLRPLTKAVRHAFRNLDTGVFSGAELEDMLDKVYAAVYGNPPAESKTQGRTT